MKKPNLCRKAVTLIEILIAVFILAVAVLPVVGTFSKFYGLASRQMEQETALKIAEAAMNKLISHRYSDLAGNKAFTVPLEFVTPEGAISGNLDFAGNMATSTPIVMGNTVFRINSSVERIFVAQNINSPHDKALEFKYPVSLPPPSTGGPPPTPVMTTYSSFDDLLMIKLRVVFGSGTKDIVELSSFRADMNK